MTRANKIVIGLGLLAVVIGIIAFVQHNNQVAAANRAHHDWVQQHVSM